MGNIYSKLYIWLFPPRIEFKLIKPEEKTECNKKFNDCFSTWLLQDSDDFFNCRSPFYCDCAICTY